MEDLSSSTDPAVTVNGRRHRLHGGTDGAGGPVTGATTALHWLRGLGLTGAKEGCAEGECGACAVLVARPDPVHGARWTAINACLVPVAALDGGEVVTAEGLGTAGDLHPVQREMAQRGGSQCGYCTPGFVCAMAAEFYRPDRGAGAEPSFDLHALSGNLCRCTGYRPIRDAALALEAVPADDPLADVGSRPLATARDCQIDGPTGFRRPADLEAVLGLLAERPDAVVVAGSTDWGVEVNLRHRRAPLTVAIGHLPELRELEVTEDHIVIGAALTLSEIERGLDGAVPLLTEMTVQFASRLIRNGATLGGNLGTASPIGDSAPALLALAADVVLTSVRGDRVVPLVDYFTGYRQTVRAADELIRAVRIPRPLPPSSIFVKVAKRRFDDISSVAVAIAADLRADDDGTVVREIRIGLGGVAATPIRGFAAEEAMLGRPWDTATARAGAAVLAGAGTPLDDHRASARYRSAMLEQAMLRFFDATGTSS